MCDLVALAAEEPDPVVRWAYEEWLIELIPGLYGTVETREQKRRLRPEYQRGQRLTAQSVARKNTETWQAMRDRYCKLRRDGLKQSRVIARLFGEQHTIKHRGNFTRRLGVAALETSLSEQK